MGGPFGSRPVAGQRFSVGSTAEMSTLVTRSSDPIWKYWSWMHAGVGFTAAHRSPTVA